MEPTVARTCSEVNEDGCCCPLDRISQLPDPILHLILCNLLGKRANRQTWDVVQTRDVVQMTITLSKRWKNLWASLPCLFFCDYNIGFHNIVPFVNDVLLLRDSSDIHTFQLHWQPEFWMHRDHHLNTWAEYVVRHNVKILTLDVNLEKVDMTGPMEFPRCIFTCPSLEELKLKAFESRDLTGFSLRTIENVRLSRLRKLHLYQLNDDRDLLGKLTSGCPVLEDLKMEWCVIDNPKISSDTLKSLSISESRLYGTTIQISCPNLQSLDFYTNETDGPKVVLENLSSLVQACTQMHDHYWYIRYPHGSKLDMRPLNFISSRSKEKQATCTRLFVCPHYNIKITFNCGVENERVIKLVKEFLDIKCDCSKLCDQQLLSA